MAKLDEIDRKIIAQLQENGRPPREELSKIIGYLLNPAALKLTPAIVMLEMESAQAMQNLITRFQDCPPVIHIFKTIGGYNLIALVVAENQDTLESISMEKCSLRSSPGIRRSEFYPISDTYFAPFLQIRENLTHKDKTVTPCNVDCNPCARYEECKCVGCPASKKYKGTL
jgi:DNA-binding Lrp family transcriptional regulator